MQGQLGREVLDSLGSHLAHNPTLYRHEAGGGVLESDAYRVQNHLLHRHKADGALTRLCRAAPVLQASSEDTDGNGIAG
jgi:hypothetical protein